eukprot:8503-Heterococcus_DN1.PRE.2
MFRSRLLTRAGLRCVARRKHVMHLHSAAKPQRTKQRSAVLVASFSAVLTTAIIVQDVLIVRKHKPAEVVARLQGALSRNNGTLESLHEVNHLLNTSLVLRPAQALVSNGILPFLQNILAKETPVMRSAGAWEAIRAITKHAELARQIATDKQFCAVITAKLLEDVALWKESLKDTSLDSAAPMKPYNLVEVRQTSALAAALQTIANILNADRVLSNSSNDEKDLQRNFIVTDSDLLNKLMLEMPWLLSCCRNRIIAGSTRQLPIPNIIFHAYK